MLEKLKLEHPEYLVREEMTSQCEGKITDSASRYGMFLMCASKIECLSKYLPV